MVKFCQKFSYDISYDIFVEEIIQTGRICRQYGVNEVFISSLLCRSSTSEMKNIREINCFIKERCVRENFIFIFNDSISEEHLWKDGLHLTGDGTTILANNFINVLNESLLWLEKKTFEAQHIRTESITVNNINDNNLLNDKIFEKRPNSENVLSTLNDLKIRN